MQQPPPDTDEQLPPITAEVAPKAPSTLAVDWALFEHHLSGSDLSEEQTREFLETIWYIVVAFVDLGFGIAPVQQALMAGQPNVPVLPAPMPTTSALAPPLTRNFQSVAKTEKAKPKARPKTKTKKRKTT